MSNVLLFNPCSAEHDDYVRQRIANMIARLSFTHGQLACDDIPTVHAETLGSKRLGEIIAHLSPIKNRISIAKSALRSKFEVLPIKESNPFHLWHRGSVGKY